MHHKGGGYRVAASLDINRDETMGAIAAFTGEIILWDVGSGLPIRILHGHREMAIGGVKFLPDGRHLLSASGDIFAPIDDFSLRLWDVQSGAEIRRFLGHTDRIWDLCLCPDCCFALSASHDGTLRRWNLQTGDSEVLANVYPQAALAVAISPDGQRLILGLGMGKSNNPEYGLRILDSATGQEVHRLIGHTEAINDIAISPDGRLAISASLDRTLQLWEIATGSHLATLSTVSDVPLRLAFSPDGRFVCEGATQGKALLWDIEKRCLIRQFSGHLGNVVEVKLSGDGRRLYSACDEGSVHEWRIDPDLSTLQQWIQGNRWVNGLDQAL
jgi:WD40 repeat protein